MGKPKRHRNKWRIRWIDETGRRRSEVYADYKAAERKLTEHRHYVEEIRRGVRRADPPAKKFGELCDYWITNRASQKRSGKNDESIIRRHLRPAFGQMPIVQLGVAASDAFVATKAHLDKKTVANILTLMVSMLNVAVDLGWAHRVPRIRKPRVRLVTSDFRYLRTDQEIQRFLTTAREEGQAAFMVYATAIYTGLRAGELAGLLWEDVDFERRLVTVQRSFDGPTKAEDVRYVPILDVLLPLLREWRLAHPGRLVFTNRDGRMLGPAARVFQEVLHRVLVAGGFGMVERKGKEKRYIVFHDLRHTFASHWVARGGDIFKLQKILGHKSIQMTMRYAHLAPSAFASDYGLLGSGAALVPAHVIPFPRKLD